MNVFIISIEFREKTHNFLHILLIKFYSSQHLNSVTKIYIRDFNEKGIKNAL